MSTPLILIFHFLSFRLEPVKLPFIFFSFLLTNHLSWITLSKIVFITTPVLVNSAGEQQEITCFEPDENTETSPCSIIWKSHLFILGGATHKRQISRLIGHRLKRVGKLSFNHDETCGVMGNKYIFLCFTSGSTTNDLKRCRRSTGPLEQFSEVASSTHLHRNIQISCSNSKLLYSSFEINS